MTETACPTCQNPFFPCVNKNPELKIIADICLKNEKYSICPDCWNTIAENENYQWTTPEPNQPKNLTLEPNWS